MVNCPYCHTDNIPGDDECAECGQPLDHAHLTPPQTAVERSLLRDRIHALDPNPAITVAASTPIEDVLRLMVERKIGCVVVADGSAPLGIFTERDALRKIGANAAELARRPVSEFMTPGPQTLVADAKIAFAVQRMDLGGFRHLPLVDQHGELVGIISSRDILRHLTAEMSAE